MSAASNGRVPSAAGAGVVRRRVEDLRPHPQAGEVPGLSADEFAALRADIAARGLQVPLQVSADGVVLDGHRRLEALAGLGVEEVEVQVLSPADELEHILRQALVRRQLTATQRAAIALKLLPFEQLREEAAQRRQANLHRDAAEVATLPAREGRTREFVAELAGSSPRTAQDVITVHEHDPALFERMIQGELSAHTAASKVRRARRDAALPAAPPLPQGPFELILADPPWSFGSPDSQFAPEQHYPTMSLSELKALELPAADDCVLFLWAVNALLPEALELCRSWGFTYKTNLVWVKPSIGPGVWLRQRHELLLVAIRGQVSPPELEERCDSVLEARRGRHSEKPEHAYERIEAMYPSKTSRLEMFARSGRPGWACWGNEAPTDSTTRGEADD